MMIIIIIIILIIIWCFLNGRNIFLNTGTCQLSFKSKCNIPLCAD